MEVTELGMVTDVRLVQLENAYSPMEVTELGMVTDVMALQLENAPPPMEVTQLGMVIDSRLVQPYKTLGSSVDNVFGRITVESPVHW